MKRIAMIVVIGMAAVTMAIGQDGPASFAFVIGPRVGVSWMTETTEEFTERVNAQWDGTYSPVTTLFGVTMEQRILLGETNSHFAFQQVIMLGAIEQSIVLPSAAFLVGYRDLSGFEIGIGPTLSLGGLGVVGAVGWTFYSKGMYIPVDISVLIKNEQRPWSVAMTTGFNFISRRAKPRR